MVLRGFPLEFAVNPFQAAAAGTSRNSLALKGRRLICQSASISRQFQRAEKRRLRCGKHYIDTENSPEACSFHGHMNGDRGLFSLAPPHQGIDGEWTDESGVIVYKWNDKRNRPNTGKSNWKKRWSCCGEYDEKATPCRRGRHVSYDDGGTLF
ncbi:hypothetical protein SUGI_0393900 [Cryptomeria japonica]|uniref:uncharacterized protein LOC131040998 n=1 Tax=Cryptomeria japonica TaxID=3369 RepID=UPI002408C657|nr:uncharacterized protein LOC131040998 [Cryptomeria japonica]GLJ21395.1 hypothetical protein SUGI_0393900 [Cryptomeria japonica]